MLAVFITSFIKKCLGLFFHVAELYKENLSLSRQLEKNMPEIDKKRVKIAESSLHSHHRSP